MLAPPYFVQVPHHGSRHNVSRTSLNRWLGNPLPEGLPNRGMAFCSVGVGDGADKYPRKVVSNAFLRRGYPVHATKGTGKRHQYEMQSRNGWVGKRSGSSRAKTSVSSITGREANPIDCKNWLPTWFALGSLSSPRSGFGRFLT